MKIFNGSRGVGKTYRLVNLSAETRVPIVTFGSVTHIKFVAERLGLDIPEPISATDIKNGRTNIRYDKYLVDEVDSVLAKLLGGEVIEATMTGEVESKTNFEEWNNPYRR